MTPAPRPHPEYLITENLLDRIYDMAYSPGCMENDEDHNKKLGKLYEEVQSRPHTPHQSERDTPTLKKAIIEVLDTGFESSERDMELVLDRIDAWEKGELRHQGKREVQR